MARVVETKEYLDMVCSLLREGKRDICVPVKGVSMRPFLRDQDLVYLNAICRPVKPGDIILFMRANGKYILHRVYRRLPDGMFLMLGDSQLEPEKISAEQMLAVVSFVRIGGKVVRPGSLRWCFYSHPWRWLAPVRKPLGRLHRLLKRN